MSDIGEMPTPDLDEINIELEGEVIDENELPGIPEIHQEVMKRTISQEKIEELRRRFYPGFTDEQITLIERTAIYHFEKFSRLAKWVQNPDNPQPKLEDFGVTDESSLEERSAVLDRLGSEGKTSSAFATLPMVEGYLSIEDVPGLEVQVGSLAADKKQVEVVDVGCGGQAADIQLLLGGELRDKNVRVTGISASDYGRNIREGFPELKGRVNFRQMNIYTGEMPSFGDLVFSVRTLPYTGLIDDVRFCAALHNMAKDDGTVWVEGVNGGDFDFQGSGFTNLAEYLEKQRELQPSLRFNNEKGEYVVYWKKNEGFPFERMKAKEIKTTPSELPYLVRYELKDQPS